MNVPIIREVKHHAYVKWKMRICTMWPSFPFTCCLLFIISTIFSILRNFQLEFAIYVKLNLSIIFLLLQTTISNNSVGVHTKRCYIYKWLN